MEKFDYVILDENNKWHSTGNQATEAELDQDIEDVAARLLEEGEEDIELVIFKAPAMERLTTTVNE